MKRDRSSLLSWTLVIIASLWIGCGEEGGAGPLVGSSEVWYRTFGAGETDEAWGIDLAGNGDLFVATLQAWPDLLPDGYVYRMSPAGEVLWEARWDGPSSVQLFVVKATEAAVYVGGVVYEGVTVDSADGLLLALDPDTGEMLWDFQWDRDAGYGEIDGIVVEDDALYLSGWTTGEGTSSDLLLLKLTLDGTLVWSKSWGSDRWDEANGHLVSDGEHLYVAGRYEAEDIFDGGDALLAAFDQADGGLVWQVTHGEADRMEDALGLTTDGEYLYAVGFAGVLYQEAYQLVLWKFDFSGNLLWRIEWGGDGSEAARAIRIDPADGSLVVAAQTGDGEGDGQNLAILRFSPEDGHLIEVRYWGGDGDEEVHDFVLAGDRAFLAGQSESVGAGEFDGLVMSFRHRPLELPAMEE